MLTLFLLTLSVLSFAQNKSSETAEVDERLTEIYDCLLYTSDAADE